MKKDITIRSSAAEYLTYVAAVGDQPDAIEIRYENENVWLTQKMMAQLYDVTVANINQHIKTIFADGELLPEATIKKYLIEVLEETLEPIRQRRKYYEEHLDEVKQILIEGTKKANEKANATLSRVRKNIGIEYFE